MGFSIIAVRRNGCTAIIETLMAVTRGGQPVRIEDVAAVASRSSGSDPTPKEVEVDPLAVEAAASAVICLVRQVGLCKPQRKERREYDLPADARAGCFPPTDYYVPHGILPLGANTCTRRHVQ